jgi:hypothetical protein
MRSNMTATACKRTKPRRAVTLFTRNGYDWTNRFRPIAERTAGTHSYRVPNYLHT